MNEKTLQDFQTWLLKNAKLSMGTARMYTKQVMLTPDIDITKGYKHNYTILNARIKTSVSLWAHIAFLKFLKDTSNDFELKKEVNMLIMDVKDMVVGKKNKTEIRDRLLTKGEMTKIYDYSTNEPKKSKIERMHNYLCFRIFYESSGRAEEVRRYRWKYIDRKARSINIPKTITKRNKARTADISLKTMDLLDEYYNTYPKKLKNTNNDYIFYRFKNYSALLNMIKRISKKSIGKEITPHWLRNSFITHVAVSGLKKGEPIPVVRDKLKIYLRHSTDVQTGHYIKIAQELLQERLIDNYEVVK